MERLPQLSAKEVAGALASMGFVLKRQQGSHMFYEHPDGRTTVVPNHPREDIDRALLQKIIKHDLRVSKEEFLQFVK